LFGGFYVISAGNQPKVYIKALKGVELDRKKYLPFPNQYYLLLYFVKAFVGQEFCKINFNKIRQHNHLGVGLME